MTKTERSDRQESFSRGLAAGVGTLGRRGRRVAVVLGTLGEGAHQALQRRRAGAAWRSAGQQRNRTDDPDAASSERAQAADQDSARRRRSPQVCVYPTIGLRDCVPRCMVAQGDRRPMCDASPTTKVISANRCAGVFEACETAISDRPQETTVAGDGLPADIGGLFRSEERGQRAELFHSPQSPRGNLRPHLVLVDAKFLEAFR